MMDFKALITRMTQAAVRGDGKAVADCFTPDGVYHDVFYGAFLGPAIADMIENYFHRDAENFIWDLHDPICEGDVGYARYVFSYDSKLPDSAGRRTIFEGVSICRLENGRIASYREVANTAPGLYALGFPPERLLKLIKREAEELKERSETVHHLDNRAESG
jgi:ketosteroid isomerase-like protein